MNTAKNICHSCHMPMFHLYDFGTNIDGSINTEYCHECYHKGIFVEHGISLEEKIEKGIDITRRTGMTA